MTVAKSREALSLKVACPEKHHNDNFTMYVPIIEVDVVPNEHEPWGMIYEGEKYKSIDVGFDGDIDMKPGYQATIVRFNLQQDFEWFADGLEIVAIESGARQIFPKQDFKTFLNKINSNCLDMTIQVTQQRAFNSKIKFRFMASEKGQLVDAYNPLKVLVSEDPVVKPNKPVGD